MDFMLFVLHFLSYTMLAYFVFQIFGRKRQISIVVLTVLLIMSFLGLFSSIKSGEQTVSIIYYFINDTLPILLAGVLFLYLTRAYRTRISFAKNKQLKLKKIYSTIYPKKYVKQLSISGSILSFSVLVMAVVIYMLDLTTMNQIIFILTVILSSLVFIFSIYQMFMSCSIEKEKIVVYVGKQKEQCYVYDLLQSYRPLTIQDVYLDNAFIIDEIGSIKVFDGIKVIEKYHLYWIATSQEISIKEDGFDGSKILFKKWISDVSKYENVRLRFRIEKNEYIEIKK